MRRASRLRLSSFGAAPKPASPRASSSFTRNSTARSKNSRATFMTRPAMSPASPRRRSSRRRACSSRNSCESWASATCGWSGAGAGSEDFVAALGAGAAFACIMRGRMSVRTLLAKTRRSASNCSGSSFESPGLNTKLSTPSCRARACTAPESESVIISTGGFRFIFTSRFTTSNPPWNEEPPDVGMPRSVIKMKGIPALPRRPAFLTAASGPSASTTWYPPCVRYSASTRRTSSSSSTSRSAGGSAGDGLGWAGGGGASTCGCGGCAGGGAASAGLHCTPIFGTGTVKVASSSSSSSAGWSSNSSSKPAGGTASVSGSLGASANEASSSAVEFRRSSSMPRARSSSSSWGLIPVPSVSSRISRDSTRWGGSSLRLKLNCPSRRRMSCSSASSIRVRRNWSRLSAVNVRTRGSSGPESQVKAVTTSPSRKTMAPCPAAARIVRCPVFLLKETIWRMSRRGRSSRLPVRLMGGKKFYTAARISSGKRSRSTARWTTPASMAAFGIP